MSDIKSNSNQTLSIHDRATVKVPIEGEEDLLILGIYHPKKHEIEFKFPPKSLVPKAVLTLPWSLPHPLGKSIGITDFVSTFSCPLKEVHESVNYFNKPLDHEIQMHVPLPELLRKQFKKRYLAKQKKLKYKAKQETKQTVEVAESSIINCTTINETYC